MNDMFKGFREIKADGYLLGKTKNRMLDSLQKPTVKFSVKKLALAAIPVITVLAILTIMLSNSFFGNRSIITAKAQDFMQDIKPQNIDVSNAITERFIDSSQYFALSLFKDSTKNGVNTLVSPTSALLALGMTSNGAASSTLDAFKSVLYKYGLTTDNLNRAYKAYANELTKKSGSTVLNISNSIWYRTDFKANKNFLQKNADYFGAGANTLNFSDKNSVNIINGWVGHHTNNRIAKIVDKIDSSDVMYLINAISFDSKWQKPFDTEGKASDGLFYLGSGSTVNVTYMHLSDNVKYAKGRNESAVLLPYDDDHFAFLCVLPSQGTSLADYIKTMSESTIPDLISHSSQTGVSISLPQFSASSDLDLNDTLKKMGLGVAFGDKANFSNMGEDRSGLGLYISEVRQKSFLQVDEAGTKAGTATSVDMRKAEIASKILNFNRPFIYAVVDTQTRLPLYLGTMENPKQ